MAGTDHSARGLGLRRHAARVAKPLIAVALLLVCAQVVLADPPTGDFTFAPASPEVDESVTFTADVADPDPGDVPTVEWDFEYDGTTFAADASGPSVSHPYASAGNRTVRMRVTDPQAETHEVSHDVTVVEPPPPKKAPTARIVITTANPTAGQPVSFSGATSSDPQDGTDVAYAWDLDNDGAFDDGTGSTASGTYPAGPTTVRLRVTDTDNATDVDTADFTVAPPPNQAPTARIVITTANPTAGQPVSFSGATSSDPEDGTDVAYAWDLDNDGAFDDGTGSTASGTYPAGPTTVRLRVTDTDNATGVDTETFTIINALPIARFTLSPDPPVVGVPVELDGRGSSDPSGSITGYAWDLDNDGAFDDGTGSTATLTFATAGSKTIRLRVTDNNGAIDTEVKNPVVQTTAPIARLSFSPGTPQPGQLVRFDSAASTASAGATITGQEWDLDGDGAFDDSTVAAPTYSFTTSGQKTVKVRVTDSQNRQSTATEFVLVNAPPIAAFRFAPATPLAGDAVDFTSIARDPDGTVGAQAWDLDNDGAFDDATGPVARRSFETAGAYAVRLRVSDSAGATDVESVPVTVLTRPEVSLPLQLMSPFPIVRIVGRAHRNGATITRLSVGARAGSSVSARCSGRGCPRRSRSIKARSRGRVVRFRRLERRLRAGTRIAIRVTFPGRIGKYTSFTIKRRVRPGRRDRCLPPGGRPVRCPSQ